MMIMAVFATFAAIYLAFRWRHLKDEWNRARPSTRYMLQGAFVIWLLGLLVAWYAPLDVLDNSTLARTYTNAISLVFPLGHYSSKSDFAQISTLYNAIIWPLLPILFALIWRLLATRKSGLLAKSKEDMTMSNRLLLLLMMAPLFTALGLIALFFWHGGDTRNVAFGSSRVDLGLYGIFGPTGVALCLAMGLASLIKAITGKL